MKQAILLVSFGVLDDKSRHRSLDALAKDFQQAFPDWQIRQAYTSRFLKAKIMARGVQIDSLPEALSRLEAEGCDTVMIQPTYLTPGEEYEKKVCDVASSYKDHFSSLLLGSPVFTAKKDYPRALAAVMKTHPLPEGSQLVLLGHGSPHRHNPVYEHLQAVIDEDHLPVHVGVLEQSDWPSFDDVLKRLQSQPCRDVVLAPLLLVGGRHVTHDMAGEDPASWQSRLEAAGFCVRPVLHGLGEYADFRQDYVLKAREDLRCHALL